MIGGAYFEVASINSPNVDQSFSYLASLFAFSSHYASDYQWAIRESSFLFADT